MSFAYLWNVVEIDNAFKKPDPDISEFIYLVFGDNICILNTR